MEVSDQVKINYPAKDITECAEIWKSFLKACGRTDNEYFGSSITFDAANNKCQLYASKGKYVGAKAAYTLRRPYVGL